MSSLDASQTNVETLKSAEFLSGLVSGLPAGLIFGLVVRPVTANTCSPAFAIASLWLGVQRRLPFHSIGFLDDAYRLGLLRIVGPVYQFRHAALQDHLAPPTETEPLSMAANHQGQTSTPMCPQ